MATVTVVEVPATTVLRRVAYQDYVRLRDEPANAHLRMTYHDGTLEIMSPEYLHEKPSRRLGLVVFVLTQELDIPSEGTQSTTFRRGSVGLKKGHGKEPDQSFYSRTSTTYSAKIRSTSMSIRRRISGSRSTTGLARAVGCPCMRPSAFRKSGVTKLIRTRFGLAGSSWEAIRRLTVAMPCRCSPRRMFWKRSQWARAFRKRNGADSFATGSGRRSDRGNLGVGSALSDTTAA